MRINLLLIDDDPALLSAFSRMITFHFPSIHLTAVDSGVAALNEVRKQDYDIVICDLMMPVMDGAMTLAEIRKDNPYLRMYLMTGHPEPEQAYKATKATGFIKKPLDRAYFLEFMKRTIQVVSTGKRAASAVMHANQRLSSSMQRYEDVERLLRTQKLPPSV